MIIMQWLLFAFLSAIFAAATSILAKIGIKGVDSNLATAIRTTVILVFAWGIVFAQGLGAKVGELSKTTWIFLVLSGIATGFSWLFYFRALQLGEASKVVPIDKLSLVLTIILAGFFLHEKITIPIIVGSILMTAGALVIALVK
jgi:bacterial/archaeal transporter family protein